MNIHTVVFTVDDEGCRRAITYTLATIYQTTRCNNSGGCNISPCHHGMARPQFADGGTVSNMEGSCKYY